MTYHVKAVLAVACTLALTACGGGGGSSGNTGGSSFNSVQAVTITSDNQTTVAAETGENVIGLGASAADLAVGAQTDISRGSHLPAVYRLSQTLIELVQQHEGEVTPSLPTGVIAPVTINCASGTMVLSFADTNGNDDLDLGETMTTTANNCVMGVGEDATTMNGVFDVKALEEGSSYLKDQVVYRSFSVASGGETGTINGAVVVRLNYNSTGALIGEEVATTNLSASFNAGGATSSMTLSETLTLTFNSNGTVSLQGNGDLSTTALSGQVHFDVPSNTPLVINYASALINSGQMTVTGANSSKLVITFMGATASAQRYDNNQLAGSPFTVDTANLL